MSAVVLSRFRIVLLVLSLFAAVGPAVSASAAPDTAAPDTAAPDPAQLLRESAAAVAAADSVSTDISVVIKLTRDDKSDTETNRFTFRTAAGERFELSSPTDEDAAPTRGLRIAGNGKVMLTHVTAARRHTLSDGEEGLAAFVRSPASAAIGNGLGGIALALLDPTAAEELLGKVTDSAYVGREAINGEPVHHARYTLAGEIAFHAWYAADGDPLVRRVVPDVSQTPSVQQMAARFTTFDYQLAFNFADWNLEAGLTAQDIMVAEPADSLLAPSLFAAPETPPYVLLGQAAPAIATTTPEGRRINLADVYGERVVMLEFWSTSCPICVQAMPELEKVHEHYADQGVEYYAVNAGESPGDVQAFLEARNLAPTALIDESGQIADAYGVSSLPLIVLIDADGQIQYAQAGYADGDDQKLAGRIESLLNGENLAVQTLAEERRAAQAKAAEREQLRSALDG